MRPLGREVRAGADDGGRRLDGGHGVARGAARDRHGRAFVRAAEERGSERGCDEFDNSEARSCASATDFAKAAHEQRGGAAGGDDRGGGGAGAVVTAFAKT